MKFEHSALTPGLDTQRQTLWNIFEPLTTHIDPMQLWSGMLDMFIGNYLGTHLDGELIPGTPPELSTEATLRDYDRAKFSLAANEQVRAGCTAFYNTLIRLVAVYNSGEVKLGTNTAAAMLAAGATLYTKKGAGRWLDIIGDFHCMLEERFDRALLMPCCASVQLTNQWVKAQFKGLSLGKSLENESGKSVVRNHDCGSGRSVLAINASYPGKLRFVCESANLLHCKYTVLNCLLHGVYAQVTLVEGAERRPVRCWDVNRWLYRTLCPLPHLELNPHVLDIDVSLSTSHRENFDERGRELPDARERDRAMQLDMLNRLSEGLGIGVTVGDTLGEVFDMQRRKQLHHQQQQVEKPVTSKGILKSLFAKQAQQQKAKLKKKVEMPVPAPPTEPTPVAATTASPAAETLGRRALARQKK